MYVYSQHFFLIILSWLVFMQININMSESDVFKSSVIVFVGIMIAERSILFAWIGKRTIE